MSDYAPGYGDNQVMMEQPRDMQSAQEVAANQAQMNDPSLSAAAMEGGVPQVVERANIRLQGDQPVVPVPVYQDIYRKDRFQSVPHVEVHDTVQPYVFHQQATHEVPRMEMSYQNFEPSINVERQVDTQVDVQVPLGYLPQFHPKWDIREVPRPVPKYVGEQQTIDVPVPQVQYVDRHVEKPIVVDVQEKIVPVVEHVDAEVEVLQYEWKQKHHDIPVYRMVPKINVELECPAPLIVPMPQTKIVNVAPTVTQSNFNYLNPCGASCYATDDAQAKREEQLRSMQSKIQEGYLSGQQLYGGSSMQQNATGLGYAHAQAPAMSRLAGKLKEDVYELKQGRKEPPRLWNLFGLLSTCDNLRTHGQEPADEEPMDHSESMYPNDMPQDFASFFQQHHQDGSNGPQDQMNKGRRVRGGQQGQDGDNGEDNELEPSVSYKGAVTKPAEFAGQLDAISFKLHAIEVHQYVDIPNHKRPEFVEALPPGALQAQQQQSLQRLFGAPPPGWADPGVTGMPAPLIKDIINNKAVQGSNMPGPSYATQNSHVVAKMTTSPLPPGVDPSLPEPQLGSMPHSNATNTDHTPLADGSNLPGRPHQGMPDNTLDTA